MSRKTKRPGGRKVVMVKRPTNNRKQLVLKNRKPKRRTALQLRLIRMMTRPTGATMHDTWKAGFKYPAMQALKYVEHQGYKTKVVHKPGELTRYFAKH